MKAVVTGASGFVGAWLVNELLSRGDDVTVIVRDEKRLPDDWKNKVHIVAASLEELLELDMDKFQTKKYDIFFHLAWAGTFGTERTNITLQLKNVQAACDAVHLASHLSCRRFVNAGSIMEYEAIQYITKDGSSPGMGNIYSTAKLTADFMAKTIAAKECIDYINVIISNIFGVGEYSTRFLNTTLRKMINGEHIPLTHGNQLYDFIYVSDAVKAIILAGREGKKNTSYYIGNKKQMPLKNFIIKMKDILKSHSSLGFGEIPLKGARLSYCEFDTKALFSLGFQPEITFEQGILLTRDWMVSVEYEYKL